MFKGITDLGGIGKLFGECRKLVMDLLRHHAGRKERHLMNVEQALKNEALRHKNEAAELKNVDTRLRILDRALTIAKKRGLSPEDVQEFIRLTSAKPISTPSTKPDVPRNPDPKLLSD